MRLNRGVLAGSDARCEGLKFTLPSFLERAPHRGDMNGIFSDIDEPFTLENLVHDWPDALTLGDEFLFRRHPTGLVWPWCHLSRQDRVFAAHRQIHLLEKTPHAADWLAHAPRGTEQVHLGRRKLPRIRVANVMDADRDAPRC